MFPFFIALQVVLKYHVAMLIIALVVATLVPAAVLIAMRTVDLYGAGAFTTVLLCFSWGVAAFGLAFGASQILLGGDILTLEQWVQVAAPITEEVLKALILLYLVSRPQFTYSADGAIYGFAAGMGFAVIENWTYVIGYGSSGLNVAIGRVLSTNLMHATASAVVGYALGFARFDRFSHRGRFLLVGWLFGMAFHIGFNNLVTRVSSGLLLLYAAAFGLIGIGIIYMGIRYGVARGKAWIATHMETEKRITRGEAAVVDRLGDLQQLLTPVAEQFGAEKAAACERFLRSQALIALKSKGLGQLPEGDLRRGVEGEIARMRVEMDRARREVGAYCMLYLRSIVPPASDPLWGDLLTARIQAKVDARSASGVTTNLWATVGERTGQMPAAHKRPGSGKETP